MCSGLVVCRIGVWRTKEVREWRVLLKAVVDSTIPELWWFVAKFPGRCTKLMSDPPGTSGTCIFLSIRILLVQASQEHMRSINLQTCPTQLCIRPSFRQDQLAVVFFERNCPIEQHNELSVIMKNTCRSLRYVAVGRRIGGGPAWRGSCCAQQSVIVEGRRGYFWMPLFKGVHDTVMGAIEIGGWITGRQPLPLRSRMGQHESDCRTAQSKRKSLLRITALTV